GRELRAAWWFLFFLERVSLSSRPALCPYTTLFRSRDARHARHAGRAGRQLQGDRRAVTLSSRRERRCRLLVPRPSPPGVRARTRDRKSTRLNSSHVKISYAVFCLKKKKGKKSGGAV